MTESFASDRKQGGVREIRVRTPVPVIIRRQGQYFNLNKQKLKMMHQDAVFCRAS
jgi:copper homeostasis protein CutC